MGALDDPSLAGSKATMLNQHPNAEQSHTHSTFLTQDRPNTQFDGSKRAGTIQISLPYLQQVVVISFRVHPFLGVGDE
jgi:hypothetical protein